MMNELARIKSRIVYDVVDITDIAVDDSTTEATTLNELLPCLNIPDNIKVKLREPIKDKELIAVIRLVYEAGNKAPDHNGYKHYLVSKDQIYKKIVLTDSQKENLTENIHIATGGWQYKSRGIFAGGNLFEGTGEDEDGIIFDRPSNFDVSFFMPNK